ncbi:MAG: ATPase, partial [Candidatus Fraserbacteria bacterium RBG_16_55_9]
MSTRKESVNSPKATSQTDLYVLDTSVIVDGRITEEVRQGRFQAATFIVPEIALAELEAQAENGQETGFAGLNELKQLQALSWEGSVQLQYKGERPRGDVLRLHESGELDSLIRRLAEEENATLLTSDRVQALVCEARGLPVLYFENPATHRLESLKIMPYFDETTMSVHLRARMRPKAKKGSPGEMKIVSLSDQPLTEKEIEVMAREIVEAAEQHPEGFIEMDSGGSTVVQLKNLRIAIARPPFSDALEITVVRPVTRTHLSDYAYEDLLKERLNQRYRGVLVSGAPGAGKSTFVQAIADYLEEAGWVIKTMEKPRDLEVSDEITQYTALEGDIANTADVLLLVRPDYTIFDEMRRTEDFQVFADLRLAGVGMVGVLHATRGIDSLQRLIGRVELGMIPQVVDTVVFIEAGDVRQIYEVEFTVKAPTGMGDEDLARPVIEVRDFESKQLAFEIYSFGEQVVVMPVGEIVAEKKIWKLAERTLEYELSRLIKGSVSVEVKSDNRAVLYIDEDRIASVVGKGGSHIREIEEKLGIGLDVRSFDEMDLTAGKDLNVTINDQFVFLDL